MAEVERIVDGSGCLLAYKIPPGVPDGLAAYSDDDDFVQVLSWFYPAGKQLQAHVHRDVPRTATLTQEAVVVMQGRMRADVFDDARNLLTEVVIEAGECMVFLRGGHGYEILDDNTRVLEIKNGPFLGVEADKEKF